MTDETPVFNEFTARMADPRACAMMRDYIAHFANPVRLKLLCRLVRGGRLCVNELVEVTGEKQSTVSQQLKQLQMARMVRRQREGNRVYYAVSAPVVEDTMRFFSSIADRVDKFQGGPLGGE